MHFSQLKKNVFEGSYLDFEMSIKAQIEGLEVNFHNVFWKKYYFIFYVEEESSEESFKKIKKQKKTIILLIRVIFAKSTAKSS